MVMNFLERELKKTGDSGDTERAGKARGSDISLPETKTVALSTPELNLKNEWLRQTRKYIKLGFHEKLGLSKQEYLDSLPQFGPQPENFKDRFDIPVVVETRIPIKQQCKLAGINYLLGDLPCVDWPNDPKGYKIPNRPYITWMQDGGAKNLDKSVEEVREKLAEDERGATNFDGIAFYLAQPEVLKHHFMDLPGTKVGSVHAPCLHLWYGQPELNYFHRVDYVYPGYGSASCGRN